MTRLPALVALIAIVALSVGACGSATSSGAAGSATPDPAVAFCPALDAYAKSLAKLQALTASSSVDDFRSAGAQARADLAALRAVAGPYVGVQLDTLQTAQAQLDSAVLNLPASPTPSDAETVVEPAVKNVLAQVVATYNAICNTHPTPSAS